MIEQRQFEERLTGATPFQGSGSAAASDSWCYSPFALKHELGNAFEEKARCGRDQRWRCRSRSRRSRLALGSDVRASFPPPLT